VGVATPLNVDRVEVKIERQEHRDNGLTLAQHWLKCRRCGTFRAADEAFAFIDKRLGRVEMGDQDDARPQAVPRL